MPLLLILGKKRFLYAKLYGIGILISIVILYLIILSTGQHPLLNNTLYDTILSTGQYSLPVNSYSLYNTFYWSIVTLYQPILSTGQYSLPVNTLQSILSTTSLLVNTLYHFSIG